jgi:leucyl-tRNA synthetase
MLSPFAPHTSEELWHMLGHTKGLTRTAWPDFDPEIAKAEEIVVPVQVNGKLRARITVPAEMGEDELRERALAAVVSYSEGKTVKKVVVAKGPLVSVVIG